MRQKELYIKIRPLARYTLASLVLFILMFTALNAQDKACLNDTVKIYIDDYRGDISWEHSLNGTDWTSMTGQQGDTISLVADSAFFVRMEVIEGNCDPVYSDVFALEIYDPPIVTLNMEDSVCINDRDFIIEGGMPAGGEYSGPGVVDGRFIPSQAGPGVHQITYYFTDGNTTCSSTANSEILVLPVTSDAEAGDDMEMIMADSVQLAAIESETGIGSWSVVSGEGGEFEDINDPQTWFYKDSAQLDYELRWTVAGNCGSNSDEISLNFFPLSPNPCPGAPIVIDADGNIYKTVQIGSQCWMAENLRTGVFVESTATGSIHSDMSNDGIIEKYCFENDTANCLEYGGLYDWDEATGYTDEEGTQGVCPDGWHVPSNQDWADLDANYKYGDAGEQLKETSSSGWGGIFSGSRNQRGAFYSLGSTGFFWSSTAYTYMGKNEGYSRSICACNGALDQEHFHKATGFSIRCVKDE